jgi:hypothetical protein
MLHIKCLHGDFSFLIYILKMTIPFGLGSSLADEWLELGWA